MGQFTHEAFYLYFLFFYITSSVCLKLSSLSWKICKNQKKMLGTSRSLISLDFPEMAFLLVPIVVLLESSQPYLFQFGCSTGDITALIFWSLYTEIMQCFETGYFLLKFLPPPLNSEQLTCEIFLNPCNHFHWPSNKVCLSWDSLFT